MRPDSREAESAYYTGEASTNLQDLDGSVIELTHSLSAESPGLRGYRAGASRLSMIWEGSLLTILSTDEPVLEAFKLASSISGNYSSTGIHACSGLRTNSSSSDGTRFSDPDSESERPWPQGRRLQVAKIAAEKELNRSKLRDPERVPERGELPTDGSAVPRMPRVSSGSKESNGWGEDVGHMVTILLSLFNSHFVVY